MGRKEGNNKRREDVKYKNIWDGLTDRKEGKKEG